MFVYRVDIYNKSLPYPWTNDFVSWQKITIVFNSTIIRMNDQTFNLYTLRKKLLSRLKFLNINNVLKQTNSIIMVENFTKLYFVIVLNNR